MSIKHYDVVRAASPSDLAEKLTHKLKEGWQPYGGPVAITPYTLMQAVAIEGEPQVGPSNLYCKIREDRRKAARGE
ncbi:DUF1737 domain-containing protein [Escherichia coli]|nr:DUF1737 domain-containing protein [Escherichia coli]AUL84535.1 DUF1737 domain-containing protein [Escherichia coli]AUL90830.1 DUF1737 domain-containing protein [Escherichia coli]AUM21960.1 DUF1737 domain-containing protein [Escherichia coli]KYU82972.1 hypothetical protein AML74_24195 [Escherichia coli]PAU31245.1 hypothetical protein BTQ08_22435 [Escherichia coli]